MFMGNKFKVADWHKQELIEEDKTVDITHTPIALPVCVPTEHNMTAKDATKRVDQLFQIKEAHEY